MNILHVETEVMTMVRRRMRTEDKRTRGERGEGGGRRIGTPFPGPRASGPVNFAKLENLILRASSGPQARIPSHLLT
eukprot:scaffold92183_cov77-Cyclotella_meneghiniana.AAC.5